MEQTKIKIYKTEKLIRSIESSFEIIFRLCGLFVVYYIFNFIGKNFLDQGFNPEILLSLVVLPAIYILKDLYIVIEPFFVEVSITETNINVKSGILTKKEDTISFKNIENIEIITTLGGRIFDYATLTVFAFGSWVEIPFVKDVMELEKTIKKKINI